MVMLQWYSVLWTSRLCVGYCSEAILREEFSLADPLQSSLLNQLLAEAPHLVDVDDAPFLFKLAADAYHILGSAIGENLNDHRHLAFLRLTFLRHDHVGRR